jgi:hypothetical protein
MAIIYYKKEDALPIVLIVLMKACDLLKLIIFKFMLKDHYQDLRGLVPTEDSSKSSDQLINEMKDPFITLLRFMHNSMQLPMLKINNIYGIDPATVIFSRHAWLKADELFWSLVTNDFILDDERQDEDKYDDEVYSQNLDMFMYSLLTIVDQLIILLDGDQIDTETAWDTFGLIAEFDSARINGKSHAYAMGALCDLGSDLLDYHDKIRNKDYSIE